MAIILIAVEGKLCKTISIHIGCSSPVRHGISIIYEDVLHRLKIQMVVFQLSSAMEPIGTYAAFKYHWKVWTFTGLNPPSGRLREFYIIHGILLNTFITFLFPVTLIVNCFNYNNIQEFCDNLTITVTDLICNLKLLNVFFNRKKLLKLKIILRKLDARVEGKEEEAILRNTIQQSHRFFFIFLYLYSAAILASVGVVVLAKRKVLMYPAWIPLNWEDSSLQYWITIIYQLLALIVQGAQDVGNDTYPQACLSLICGHLKVLCIRLSKIAKDPRKCLTKNYNELRACIADHQDILQLIDSVQDIISPASLAQTVGSGLVQCTIAVCCLRIGFDISRLTSMAIFFVAVTLEIFVLCYFGSQLTYESEQLLKAVVSCNWVDQSEEFKSLLLIFLQKSQKTNAIVAGKMIPMSLPTFFQIIKMAYSFFAFMNTLP